MMWDQDPQKWVMRYMGGLKEPQTAPMAVGTVFDAMVKNKLDDRVSVDDLLAGSLTIVDPVERQKALDGGQLTFAAYMESRNWAELRRFLDDGWELDLEGDKVLSLPWLPPKVEGGEPGIIRVRVKPDLVAIQPTKRWGLQLDFKLNGFFSKAGASVPNGYCLKSRKVGMFWEFESKGQASPMTPYLGTMINPGPMSDDAWTCQLGLYGWGYGFGHPDLVKNATVSDGSATAGDILEWIAWIEQATWRTDSKGRRCPSFGSHRHRLTAEALTTIKQRVTAMWTAIKVDLRPLKEMNFAGGLTEETAMMRAILGSSQNGTVEYDIGLDVVDFDSLT